MGTTFFCALKKEELQQILAKYLPIPSVDWVADTIVDYRIHLTITPGRTSKLGDYRPPFRNKGHRISVNHNLKPDEFLLTYVHELAHLLCFNTFKNKVAPHGSEWKKIYVELMYNCMANSFFSETLVPHLHKHLQKPGASSCADVELQRHFRNNHETGHVELVTLPHGSVFKLGRHHFRKEDLQRTRYRCFHLAKKRYYLVQKHAPVIPLEKTT